MYLLKEDLKNPRIRTQLDRVLVRFGLNMANFAYLLGVPRSTVHRWSKFQILEDHYYYGGIIPAKNWDIIRAAAVVHGVVLTIEDYDPRPYILISESLDEWVPYERAI